MLYQLSHVRVEVMIPSGPASCCVSELRERCTAAAARSYSVSPHDAEHVRARAAWRDAEVLASYRRHRPPAERPISWLVAKNNRRFRFRGIESNDPWLKPRAVALNLRRQLALGLAFDGGRVPRST
jgi:hypothetical protein